LYTIAISVNGRIPSKKNSKSIKIKHSNGKTVGVPVSSKKYYQWHKHTLNELKNMNVPKLQLPNIKEIELTIYFPDKRKADLTNKAESIMDTLVDYEFIKDDQWQVCPRIILQAEYRKNFGGFKSVFKIKGTGEGSEYLSLDQSNIDDKDCVDGSELKLEVTEFDSFDL